MSTKREALIMLLIIMLEEVHGSFKHKNGLACVLSVVKPDRKELFDMLADVWNKFEKNQSPNSGYLIVEGFYVKIRHRYDTNRVIDECDSGILILQNLMKDILAQVNLASEISTYNKVYEVMEAQVPATQLLYGLIIDTQRAP